MLSPPTPATLAALDRAFVTSGPDAPPATLDLLMSVLEYAELRWSWPTRPAARCT